MAQRGGYSVQRFATDTARRNEPLALPGTYLQVLQLPAGTNAEIRVGSVYADPIPVNGSTGCRTCEPFETVYLTHDAVAGAEIILGVGEDTEIFGTLVQADVSDRPDRSLGKVAVLPSSELYAGDGTASDTAAALAASQAVAEVEIQCKTDSPESIFIGNATAQPIELEPGDSRMLEIANLATLYVRSSGGTGTYAYLARGD